VNCKVIQCKDRELYANSETSGPVSSRPFVATTGWLRRLPERWNLLIHRKTTEAQRFPDDLIDKMVRLLLVSKE